MNKLLINVDFTKRYRCAFILVQKINIFADGCCCPLVQLFAML